MFKLTLAIGLLEYVHAAHGTEPATQLDVHVDEHGLNKTNLCLR